MDIFRITDDCQDISKRKMYSLLDKLSTFTLLECKGKLNISLKSYTPTVILDHFDEAIAPLEILTQIESIGGIEKLIIVDSDPVSISQLISHCEIKRHIFFSGHMTSDTPKTLNDSLMLDDFIGLIQLTNNKAA